MTTTIIIFKHIHLLLLWFIIHFTLVASFLSSSSSTTTISRTTLLNDYYDEAFNHHSNIWWFTTRHHSYLNQFNKEKFYYVHSFYAQPSDIVNQIGTTNYYDKNFCAITIKNENIIGTQFHPEKSSKVGLDFFKSIIKNTIN